MSFLRQALVLLMIASVISSCADEQQPSSRNMDRDASNKEANDSQASDGKQGKHKSSGNDSKGSAKEGKEEAEPGKTPGNKSQGGVEGCSGSQSSSTNRAPGAARADPCDLKAGGDHNQQDSHDETTKDDDKPLPDDKDPSGARPPVSSVTFAQVQPIAQRSCGGLFCHSTYTQEATWRTDKDAIKREVESGSMPRGWPLSSADKELVLSYLETL
jgi:hypothetical protein